MDMDLIAGVVPPEVLDGWEPQPLGTIARHPDLSPSDPLREKKVAVVRAHIRVCEVSRKFSGPGSLSPSQFAAYLDAMGEEAGRAQGYGWYFDALTDAPAGPSPELMSAAGVPDAVARAAMRYEAPRGVEAYRVETGGMTPRAAWLARTPMASVAAAWLCGCVPHSKFVGVAALLMDSDGRGRFGPDGSSKLFSDLRSPSLLALDGMDAGGWTKRAASMLATVIDERWRSGLPIAYAAPFSVREFEAHVAREADAESAERLAKSVSRSLGRGREERAAHMIPCSPRG